MEFTLSVSKGPHDWPVPDPRCQAEKQQSLRAVVSNRSDRWAIRDSGAVLWQEKEGKQGWHVPGTTVGCYDGEYDIGGMWRQ